MVVEWNFESISAFFRLALFLSIGTILILMRLIQSGAAANVASLFYLVPPATAVEAWWLFDEKIRLACDCGYAGSGTWCRNIGLTTPESIKGW